MKRIVSGATLVPLLLFLLAILFRHRSQPGLVVEPSPLDARHPATVAGESARKPNVVVLITDDQGYGDLACHGNPILKTPHLDKLHGESVRLTSFHVDPTCSPTRAALMT